MTSLSFLLTITGQKHPECQKISTRDGIGTHYPFIGSGAQERTSGLEMKTVVGGIDKKGDNPS